MTKIKGPSATEFVKAIELGREFWEQTKMSEAVDYDEESVYHMCKAADAQGLFFVAVDDDREVVGFVVGIVTPFHFNSNELSAAELAWYVKPEHRKDGTGKALAEIFVESVRLKGAKFVSMMNIEEIDPEPVARLYKSMGFTPSERTYIKVF